MRTGAAKRSTAIALTVLLSLAAVTSVQSRPFSRERLVKVLSWIGTHPVPVSQVLRIAFAEEIRKQGVDFKPDTNDQRMFAVSGATNAELLAIRESYRESPFTLAQIKNALEVISDGSVDRAVREKVIADIERRGVDFRVDGQIERDLGALRADEVFVASVMKGYRGTDFHAGWVEVGESLHAIDVNPVSGRVYVASTGKPGTLWLITPGNNQVSKAADIFENRVPSIVVVDPVSNLVILPLPGDRKVITIGGSVPEVKFLALAADIVGGVAVDPVAGRIYTTLFVQKGAGAAVQGYQAQVPVPEESGIISADLSTGSQRSIVVGEFVREIDVDPLRRKILALFDKGVAIVDARDGSVQRKVVIGNQPCGLVLNLVAGAAFAGDCGARRIFRIGYDGALEGSFPTSAMPEELFVDPVSNRLFWVSRDGLAWSDFDGREISSFTNGFTYSGDLPDVTKRGVAVDPLRNRAFAVAARNKDLIVIEDGRSEVRTLSLPGPPNGYLALNPATGHLYVPLENGNVAIVREGAP
ncbi:MAG: hypothetical protein IPM63_13970 [Acidobacteriota bacterium]|nr:MAG: hypothetical protein IPM63_13970 [Acidobacteriota bacterium]